MYQLKKALLGFNMGYGCIFGNTQLTKTLTGLTFIIPKLALTIKLFIVEWKRWKGFLITFMQIYILPGEDIVFSFLTSSP